MWTKFTSGRKNKKGLNISTFNTRKLQSVTFWSVIPECLCWCSPARKDMLCVPRFSVQQDRGREGAAQDQLCSERCKGCDRLPGLQKSWFSVPITANGGILFTSSVCRGARRGLAVPAWDVWELLALALQTKCVTKPHGQEPCRGLCKRRAALWDQQRLWWPLHAGWLPHPSICDLSIQFRSLQGVPKQTTRWDSCRISFFSDLWERASSVLGRELVPVLLIVIIPSVLPPEMLWRAEDWFGYGTQCLGERTESLSTDTLL